MEKDICKRSKVFNVVDYCLLIYATFFVSTEIGPVTITTDPKKFQYELRELYVQVSEMENHVSLADFPHF